MDAENIRGIKTTEKQRQRRSTPTAGRGPWHRPYPFSFFFIKLLLPYFSFGCFASVSSRLVRCMSGRPWSSTTSSNHARWSVSRTLAVEAGHHGCKTSLFSSLDTTCTHRETKPSYFTYDDDPLRFSEKSDQFNSFIRVVYVAATLQEGRKETIQARQERLGIYHH